MAALSQSYVRNLEAGKYDNPTVDSLELMDQTFRELDMLHLT